jgi:uncharacterized membrane protein
MEGIMNNNTIINSWNVFKNYISSREVREVVETYPVHIWIEYLAILTEVSFS